MFPFDLDTFQDLILLLINLSILNKILHKVMVINVNFKIFLIISKLCGIIDESRVLKKRFFLNKLTNFLTVDLLVLTLAVKG